MGLMASHQPHRHTPSGQPSPEDLRGWSKRQGQSSARVKGSCKETAQAGSTEGPGPPQHIENHSVPWASMGTIQRVLEHNIGNAPCFCRSGVAQGVANPREFK